jgi:ribosomal protein L37AE/L43A
VEKADPTCPTCHKPAKLSRNVNALVDFWECEDNHMFSVDIAPPPRVSAASAAREAAKAKAEAEAIEAADPSAKAP